MPFSWRRASPSPTLSGFYCQLNHNKPALFICGPSDSAFLARWRPVVTCLLNVMKAELKTPFAVAEGEWMKDDQQDECLSVASSRPADFHLFV